MNKARHWSLAFGTLAAVLVVVGCQEAASPSPGTITAGVKPPRDEECANFRLTGGGRTDDRSHVTWEKSTPESHDFATFGFNARPNGCPGTDGRGNLEWNEHGTVDLGTRFAFHGRVGFFTTSEEGEGCGRFGGFGRFNPRDGATEEGVPFTVNHACDVAEPGHGADHISITIGPLADGSVYERHGLLSGGNIQWHRLTGNSN